MRLLFPLTPNTAVEIFHTPFAVYTDPTHQVYRKLGMTIRTTSPGHTSHRGAYIRHSTAQGIAMVLFNAVRVMMPVWEKSGNTEQLGGEFVLGPG